MSYSTSNPPSLIAQRIGDGPAIWIYKSADVDSDTNAGSYYSDGVTLGMQVGDFVLVYDTTTPKCSFHYVASASGNAVTTAFGAVA
jgi:hypothetical protein